MNKSNILQPSINTVCFPIIQHIKIDGYEMFPNGLDHYFQSGMNIIVGINGIGKTTLLSILFRMLAGDQDLRSDAQIGDSKRELGKINVDTFAIRVPDRARNAFATLTIRLGKHKVVIQRSLSSLKIQELDVYPPLPELANINDIEEKFKQVICHLSKLDDFYDFILILRYLVFYLEDRRTLIWDKSAQTEILRILFYPEKTQEKYKRSLGDALSADSYIRNVRSVLNREKGRYEKIRTEQLSKSSDLLPILEAAVLSLEEAFNLKVSQKALLDEKRRSLRQNIEMNRNDAEVLHQKERSLREKLIGEILPNLNDFGAFIVSNIQSLHGCIVCGNKDAELLEVAREQIQIDLNCPICKAGLAYQEPHPHAKLSRKNKKELTELSDERKRHLKNNIALEEELKKTQVEYIEAERECWNLEVELISNRQRLSFERKKNENASSQNINELSTRIQTLEDTIKESEKEREDALINIKTIIDLLTINVEIFKNTIIDKFSEFIKAFLAETCELTYRNASRKIGQLSSPTVDLTFPEFHVNMTSGVFKQSGSPREDITSVSESQREFIELAFRMSMLSMVAASDAAILVMETPEANLDAVFIPMAGDCFNRFIQHDTKNKSTIITTSNLNGTEMIPALLGLLKKPNMPVSEKKERVLDLMAHAAKSAALNKYPSEYKQRFNEALRIEDTSKGNA